MAAPVLPLVIEQNATFELDAYWQTEVAPIVPVNVLGYTGKMQIKTAVAGTVLYTLTTLTGTSGPSFTSTLGNGGIIVGSTDGYVGVTIPDYITDALTWTNGVYDLIVTSPAGFSTKILQGTITVSPGVTLIASPTPPTLVPSREYAWELILT